MAGEAPWGEVQDSTPQSCDSPISILPPELLADVFELCTVIEAFSPVLLSHVSRLWRRTAITTPKLWCSISVRLPTATPRITSTRVRTWLARSGAFPLHISLVANEWRDEISALSLLTHVRSHSRHWSRLTLIAASCDIARQIIVFLTSFPRHDMLSRIDLIAGADESDETPLLLTGDNEDPRRDITAVLAGLTETYAPRFTEFNIETYALPYSWWGATTRPVLSHLRTLRIFERHGLGDSEISALSVLHFLAKCPALEFLSFRGSNLFDSRGATLDTINLPHLRHLHLAETFHQRMILSHLFTPALEVLLLSWLNRPEALIDESYHPDPSEINEEPAEYSQSPYTDLLTGAGVRSLVRCSTPPIRVLDMDFADARSPKDFVWIFEHLPTLESFRIIGSDMSDRVLHALAFKRQGRTWLCPRLTSLEFSRCDVITGRGIVALAKGRNPRLSTNDGTAIEDGSRPARLSRFIIEACARVDCGSVAVMQYILGDVDFDVEVVPSRHIYPEEGLRMPH